MYKVAQLRNSVPYLFLVKAAVGGAFAMLTLCGVTLPPLGIEFTPHIEWLAMGSGGLLGALISFRS